MDLRQTIQKNVDLLSSDHDVSYPYIPLYERQLPSIKDLNGIVETIREILFPGYFGSMPVSLNSLEYHTGVNLEKLYNQLITQVTNALHFDSPQNAGNEKAINEKAKEICAGFINKLPVIKYLLSTDVKAIMDGDPAAKNYAEIIFCYPAMKALLNHRVAHEMLQLGIPLIPRIISEIAHTETGIDIHPQARIGEYFSIDHGTGVVIGQTTIIGNHVRLYQGVTLGAKSFALDDAGNPVDIPRHPIIEDDVTIYSNSSILGRITIGKGTTIGGNIWLTHSVKPYSKIVQTKAVELSFSDGSGI
ncbi:MAG: serine acetyltransferase [Dysgonamonadaceae bacterium]|jgi:serine O-acetyltransferase|nr:serine acetyltransferase [Dysgonamonadaceae bacterium]